MEQKEREYTNGEITVFWKPSKCIHSTICFSSLLYVFDPSKRPWVNMQGAPTEDIVRVVDRCPSKALSWEYNDPNRPNPEPIRRQTELVKVEVIKGGPLLIEGKLKIITSKGITFTNDTVYFCRCGESSDMPFCDGTHKTKEFEK